MTLHPLALVNEKAVIGKNVVVEAFAVVKGNVKLEDNVTIKSHAYIDGYTTIKKNTTIWPGACIGTKTQDLKFKGEKTFIEIGENCDIREFVTINSSCQEGSVVKIGNNCLIMAYCHIAHNCTVGNRVIMANNATLAGHVEVEDYAIIGGFTPIHQFSRVGCYAMVGGMSRVSKDIPRYSIGGGDPYKLGGINIIGLKRHGFSLSIRQGLAKAFRLTYRRGLPLKEALETIQKEVDMSIEVKNWIDFCKTSKRGLLGLS